ncbi:hypothetical protein HZC07_02715 [Candidatus Micrarchaeota archaeon]|nr:hypothetical protein [Candidatus Micrarchaeota archaeon]
MKKIAVVIGLIFLMPIAFAAWETTAALAFATSAVLLAIVYMIAIGFSINELQMMVKEEFFQLIVAALLVAVLFGANGLINKISTNSAFTQGGSDLQSVAVSTIDNTTINMTRAFNLIGAADKNISIEASKASSCSVQQIGFSMSGCGGFTMLSTPLSMAGGITGFALGELGAMKRLLVLSQNFALLLLLPVGILLRTFKITRGAGGLIIAIAISLHIMLPASIVFNSMMSATFFESTEPTAAAASQAYKGQPTFNGLECQAQDSGIQNENAAVSSYNLLRADLRKYLYVILIEATLGPVLALLVTMASIRALSAVAGAEVDISAISRFV